MASWARLTDPPLTTLMQLLDEIGCEATEQRLRLETFSGPESCYYAKPWEQHGRAILPLLNGEKSW